VTLPPVRIYEVVREWTTHVWLCDACVVRRRASRWNVRSSRLPPPREVVVVRHSEGDYCPAMLDARVPIRCQDCHLGELAACPTCGGPVVFPGAVGLNPCEDAAHVRTDHVPAEVRAEKPKDLGTELGTKGGKKKSVRKPRSSP
jgi:hypothetical protein